MLNPIDSIHSWYQNARPDEGWAEAAKNFVLYRMKALPMAVSAILDAASSAFTALKNAFSSVGDTMKGSYNWMRGEPSEWEFNNARRAARKTAHYAARSGLFALATPLAPAATLLKPSWGASLYERAHMGVWLHEDVTKDANETVKSKCSFDVDWGRATYKLDGRVMNENRGKGVQGAIEQRNFLAALGGDQEKWKGFLYQGWGAIAVEHTAKHDILIVKGLGCSYDVQTVSDDRGSELKKIVMEGAFECINPDENLERSSRHLVRYSRITTVDPETMFIKSSYLTLKQEL